MYLINKKRTFFTIIILLFILLSQGFISTKEYSDTFYFKSTQTSSEHISAIVVAQSASGNSYMNDREKISTMPELTNQEEIENFISKYESSSENAALVRKRFESLGFNIIAQDNLFLVVSGTMEDFEEIIPSMKLTQPMDLKNNGGVYLNDEFSYPSSLDIIVDGLIIQPQTSSMELIDDEIFTPSSFLDTSSRNFLSEDFEADYDDVLRALKLDRVHALGIKGNGVRVGLIDGGVYSGHEFFSAHPTNMSYLKFVDNKITFVGNNFNTIYDTGHGTAVASYLVNSAPEAKFYSMAKPTEADNAPDNSIISYLVFINQYHLLDVLNLSIGPVEEEPEAYSSTPEVRIQLLNFINNGGIVFVAGGNTGQLDDDSGKITSGHNAWAAIPEVIAVGGSELIQVGSSFVFKAADGENDKLDGAASFTSVLYPGRHVPDVVGIFGPLKIPQKLGGYQYKSGTSIATPQIAGMIALLKSGLPDLSQSQVKSILQYNSFDIIDGFSGDGDTAGIGYDLATGYGQPLATWVLQDKETLYPGWNLIGATTDYSFTAESMLRNIQTQGGNCDSLAVYRGNYEGLVIDNGVTYGFDFEIYPEEAIWIRCHEKSYWTQPGSYINSVIPIQFYTGWNGITIPHSDEICSAKDISLETNGTCWTISEYDGRFNSYIFNGEEYGENFFLSSGKGYFVRCDSKFLWTPKCSGLSSYFSNDVLSSPNNIVNSLPNNNFEIPVLSTKQISVNQSLESTNCSITNKSISNVSGNTFSVSWTTIDPCPGSLLFYQGIGTTFEAFDDRGLNYSGTTHHVTVKGLNPLSTYDYQIVSGNIIDSISQITTGANLSQPSTQYNVTGLVVGEDWEFSPNAVVYAYLEDQNGIRSSLLSFPLNENNEGFTHVLGNSRILNNSSYYSLSTAVNLHLDIQGGSAGNRSLQLPISLTTSPHVLVPGTILETIPDKPILLSPKNNYFEENPIFHFYSSGISSQVFKYRIEISKDNFASIENVFDQRISTDGWSAYNYPANQEVSFVAPVPFDKNISYQWRVYTFDINNNTWSSVSEIQGFSITDWNRIFLPSIMK